MASVDSRPSTPFLPAVEGGLQRFAEFELDFRAHELRRAGDAVPLPPRELELLMLLVRNPGRLVTYTEISATLWSDATVRTGPFVIRNLVRRLRLALEDDARNPRFIATVNRKGLRFVAPTSGTSLRSSVPPLSSEAAPGALDTRPPTPSNATVPAPRTRWPRAAMALAAMAIALAAALASGAHGTAILLFGAITAGLAAAALRYTATPIQRIAIAAFELAAASYTLSAWNLSQVAQDVVNLGTLKPALLYPFVTGLRYIPVYVVVLFYWAALAVRQDTGFAADIFHRRTYWGLACAFTMLTIVAVATGYGDGAIWTSGLPDRAIIMSCHVIVFILNTTLAVVAFRHFNRHRISSHAPLFASCVVVFVGIAATAVIMEHRYEVVNRGHIDVRRPVGYVASNPDAIVEYRRNLAAGVPSDAGPDFVRLVNDAEFERALREDRFYRRSFDEPFQITGGAVIYGYRPRIATTLAEPRFVFVRLPPALARALQFRAVRE